jgi:hypothetical protein
MELSVQHTMQASLRMQRRECPVDIEKCDHAPCSCPRSFLFGAYCCSGCRDAAEATKSGAEPLTGCQCGHADCGGVTQPLDVVEGLLIASEAFANGSVK